MRYITILLITLVLAGCKTNSNPPKNININPIDIQLSEAGESVEKGWVKKGNSWFFVMPAGKPEDAPLRKLYSYLFKEEVKEVKPIIVKTEGDK